jgi:hypothetical protein
LDGIAAELAGRWAPVVIAFRSHICAGNRRAGSGGERVRGAGRLSRIAAVLLLATTLVPMLAGGAEAKIRWKPPVASKAGLDAVQAVAMKDLTAWTNWLKANKAQGYVGEIGWPSDDARWGALATRFYTHAQANDISVSTWVTGEWAHRMQLANYKWVSNATFTATPSAAVMEQHAGRSSNPNGVNVTGPEMGAPVVDPTSSFSNANVGTLESNYHYDAPTTFTYLASRGVGLVRIPFRWERMQRAPYAPLDPAELDRLRALVRSAADAGLKVVLDMHNYGGYYLHDGTKGVRRAIGSPQLPTSAFVDVWTKMAVAFAGESGVTAFDLMNEPTRMPALKGARPAKTWESASQLAVNAIRATGDKRQIMVAGYDWSGMRAWAKHHPTTWIVDPARNFRYEAHQYWDANTSGIYRSYDDELAAIAARG